MVLTFKYVIHLKFNCISPTNKEMDFRIKHKPRLFFFLIISCIPEASMVLEKSLNGKLCEKKFFSITENLILPRYSLNFVVRYPDEQENCHGESIKKANRMIYI